MTCTLTASRPLGGWAVLFARERGLLLAAMVVSCVELSADHGVDCRSTLDADAGRCREGRRCGSCAQNELYLYFKVPKSADSARAAASVPVAPILHTAGAIRSIFDVDQQKFDLGLAERFGGRHAPLRGERGRHQRLQLHNRGHSHQRGAGSPPAQEILVLQTLRIPEAQRLAPRAQPARCR
jgi:hypothetical protein